MPATPRKNTLSNLHLSHFSHQGIFKRVFQSIGITLFGEYAIVARWNQSKRLTSFM